MSGMNPCRRRLLGLPLLLPASALLSACGRETPVAMPEYVARARPETGHVFRFGVHLGHHPRKLDQAFRVGSDAEGTGLVGFRLPLDRAALSVALGRDNVVHLALADRASAERVAIPLRRLLHFLGGRQAAVTDGTPDSRATPTAN